MPPKAPSRDSQIKKLLKSANLSLTAKNPDSQGALDIANEVLELDSDNYHAWIFKGLALTQLANAETTDGSLNDTHKEPAAAFLKAAQLNPEALFPWKALLDIKDLDPNFVDFFNTLQQCAVLMVQTHSKKTTAETEDADKESQEKVQYSNISNDDLNFLRFKISEYIQKFDYKNNQSLHIHYLHFITPHLSQLGDILGGRLQSPVQSVNQLIDLYSKIEQNEIKSALQRAKTGWNVNATAKAKFLRESAVKWAVYKSSRINQENLWELLVDLEAFEDERSNGNDKRWNVMAKQIEYLTQILYCAPDGTESPVAEKKTTATSKATPAGANVVDEKSKIRAKIQDIQSTLVLLKAQIQPIWNQYFEWSDPATLHKLDHNEVVRYVKSFGKNRGLGKLLYLLSISEISPWDNLVQDQLQQTGKRKNRASKIKLKNKKKSKQKKSEDDEIDQVNTSESQESELLLGPQQIFEEMTIAMNDPGVSESILANRIYIAFCIHLKEYQLALDQSHKYAALLSDLKLKTGLTLDNSTLEYAFNLAIIYTYYESPKNFPKAEKLYIKVLKDDPHNIRALIGMARIKIENGLFEESKLMFENVLELMVESNLKINLGEVLMEYGWCCINLGDYENGRSALNKAKAIIFDKPKDKTDEEKCEEDEENDENEENDEDETKADDDSSEKSEEESESESDSEAASLDVKATLFYREAQSYLMELNTNDAEDNSELITKAFHHLIQCIKISSTYAPAYTSLGELYTNNAESCTDQNEVQINKNKAFKCFYRAFELDPGELRSTYSVTEHFAEKKDWDMVDLICNSTLENERARKTIVSFTKNKSKYFGPWPYRILGIVHMERQDDDKAIEYFQMALRIDQHDYSSWIALGEAYLTRGKIEASKKVFKHVICLQALQDYNEIDTLVDVELTNEILDRASCQPIFLMAEAASLMGDYQESFYLLKGLLERGDIEKSFMKSHILTKICEVLVSRSGKEIFQGAIMRSLATLTDAFNYFSQSIQSSSSLKLWKIYQDSLILCINTQSHIKNLPFEIINNVIDSSFEKITNNKELIISDIWEELKFTNDRKLHVDQSNSEKLDTIHYCLALAGMTSIALTPKQSSRLLLASLLYNLAVLFISWYRDSQLDLHRDIAIKLLKRSLQYESNNAGYWNLLGLVLMSRNAKVSQHCFIKALSIDTKAAPVWFNLGMLYIKFQDYELANQAFMRSQSIAPGTSSAWAGQGIVANAQGDKDRARTLFTHSFVTSNGKNTGTTLLYSTNVLDAIIENFSEETDLDDVQRITSATSAILNYLKHYPEDSFALEVACSIIERLHMFEKSIEISEILCALVQKQYDSNSDDVAVATTYARILVQMSRLKLGNKQYEDALKLSGEVTAILESLFAKNIFNETIQRIQLSTFSVCGLSKYFTGDYDSSLQELGKIVEVFPDTKRVVILISQVLYAIGTEETKEAAIEELLVNIQEQGSSLMVVMTIAAISILENREEYMDAVKDELDKLDFASRIEDMSRQVPMLLEIINKRLQVKSDVWQRHAFMFPQDTAVWGHLNANVALEVSGASSGVDASTLADVSIAVGGLRETQRGIWLSPSIAKLEGLRNQALT